MNRTFTCILCPNGCEIRTEYQGTEIRSVSGNKCPKGAEYVEQEITAPVRNLTSSVLVENGALPLGSVRLTRPVPKDRLFDIMAEIRKVTLQAPVQAGQIVIPDVLGLGSDVIATRDVEPV